MSAISKTGFSYDISREYKFIRGISKKLLSRRNGFQKLKVIPDGVAHNRDILNSRRQYRHREQLPDTHPLMRWLKA